jgi:hypothetical protein
MPKNSIIKLHVRDGIKITPAYPTFCQKYIDFSFLVKYEKKNPINHMTRLDKNKAYVIFTVDLLFLVNTKIAKNNNKRELIKFDIAKGFDMRLSAIICFFKF